MQLVFKRDRKRSLLLLSIFLCGRIIEEEPASVLEPYQEQARILFRCPLYVKSRRKTARWYMRGKRNVGFRRLDPLQDGSAGFKPSDTRLLPSTQTSVTFEVSSPLETSHTHNVSNTSSSVSEKKFKDHPPWILTILFVFTFFLLRVYTVTPLYVNYKGRFNPLILFLWFYRMIQSVKYSVI